AFAAGAAHHVFRLLVLPHLRGTAGGATLRTGVAVSKNLTTRTQRHQEIRGWLCNFLSISSRCLCVLVLRFFRTRVSLSSPADILSQKRPTMTTVRLELKGFSPNPRWQESCKYICRGRAKMNQSTFLDADSRLLASPLIYVLLTRSAARRSGQDRRFVPPLS